MSDCSACHGRHLCPYHEGYEDGLDEGVARERADIIAWLRSDKMNKEQGPDGEEYGILSKPKGLAEVIERGEHYEEAHGE